VQVSSAPNKLTINFPMSYFPLIAFPFGLMAMFVAVSIIPHFWLIVLLLMPNYMFLLINLGENFTKKNLRTHGLILIGSLVASTIIILITAIIIALKRGYFNTYNCYYNSVKEGLLFLVNLIF
jgi:hypothetical protein